MIRDTSIQRVKDLPVKDVLESYGLQFLRKGSSYVCCCPLHNEKTPSFSLNIRRNTWHCFGCGKGGSAIDFIMERDNLSFHEAVENIARGNGIELQYDGDKENTDEKRRLERRQEELIAVTAAVQRFYVKQLAADNQEAAGARQYAYNRWGEAFCKECGIGYAPKDSGPLLDYLKQLSLPEEDVTMLGITGINERDDRQYAQLRQRVTIPICDRWGRVIAFTGRYIGANRDVAKYMNSKTSQLFKKDETLFGIDVASKQARSSNYFIMVEGAPDVLRLQTLGLTEAVAPLGTALTEKHLRQMKRFCSAICFIPDSDPPKGGLYPPGTKAVMRNGMLAMECGFDVAVKEIPRSKEDDLNEVKHDPDSYITSTEVYHSMESVPFVVWYTRQRLQGADTSELKSEVINEVARMLLNVTDENLREMYLDKLSRLVGKMKMWRDAVKRAGRKIKEEENTRADADGMPGNILDSLRRCGFIPRNGCYYAPDDDGNLNRCSNFLFSPVLHIKHKKRSSRIFRLTNNRGEEDVVEFASSDLVTIRDFNKKLFDRGNFMWRGDAKSMSSILEHLLEVTPSASLIEILGWDNRNEFYAFSNGIYSAGKFLPTDKLGVVADGARNYYLPAFSEIHAQDELTFSFERLYRCNPKGAVTLHDFVEQVTKVYGAGGMIGFAWTLAAVFRDVIFNRLKWFPVLNLFGRKGSGKTELARALSSLFYTLPSTPCSCTNTSIPVIGYNLSHARNSVFILDEFTNDLMPNRIDIIKGLWGGTARSKMEDGMPITIPVTSGVILAGQYKPENEAVFSRSIHLMYSQTSFSREEKRNFNELAEMVLHGNTHLLLPLLDLRGIFEQGFFQAFDMTLNDVLSKLDKEVVEDRILKNWVVALAAFRVLEPHIDVPFSYNDLFEQVVKGIRYQNEQIRKSSDTANFWLYLDSMHTQGKVKERCHFVIKRLSSFAAINKNKVYFVEPKQIIFLNFKAVRGLLEQRIARQKTGETLNMETLESYLKSLPQFLGIKQQRFQILRNNGELDEQYEKEGLEARKYLNSNPSSALCFDYDSLKTSLDLNLETFRITEEELTEDNNNEERSVFDKPAPSKEEELPF